MINFNVIFIPLFDEESKSLTYIIGDHATREVVVIDPVRASHQRDLRLLNEVDLKVKYIIETHRHEDRITGADMLRAATRSLICVGEHYETQLADKVLDCDDGLAVGSQKLRVLSTPGHSQCSISIYFEPYIFTGESLTVRGCGRTDLNGGSQEMMYESVKSKIYSLPEETIVCPSHAKDGVFFTSIREERKFNNRLGDHVSKDKFHEKMENLRLFEPKKMKQILKSNSILGKK